MWVLAFFRITSAGGKSCLRLFAFNYDSATSIHPFILFDLPCRWLRFFSNHWERNGGHSSEVSSP